MRRLGWIVFVLVSSLAAAPSARAEKHVALVIGNSVYQHTPTFPTDMAAAFEKHGFHAIEGVVDLDEPTFDRIVRDFVMALKGCEGPSKRTGGYGHG